MDGTAGALLIWASWAGGGDPDLERFLAYRPPQPERVRPWLRLVAEPGRRALADLDSYLARRERLAELFRHREMP